MIAEVIFIWTFGGVVGAALLVLLGACGLCYAIYRGCESVARRMKTWV